ncbi:MAG: response regulator [Lachnospiraceae bacterium]|nr:response regulator [Lachnospiraceae bacterium]
MQKKYNNNLLLTYTEPLKQLITIILFLLLTYLFVSQIFLPDERDIETSYCQVFQSNWTQVKENGEQLPVDVPSKIPAEPGEIVTLSTTLPETISDGTYLCFYTIWQDVDVYIDGVLRYHYNTENSRPMGNGSITRYLFVELQSADAGKELSYQFSSNVRYAGTMSQVLIGDRYSIWYHLFEGSTIKTVVSGFLFMLSLFCVFICLILKYIYKKQLSLHSLSLAIMLCSFWMLTELEIRQLILPNLSAFSAYAYWSLMLVPFPMLIYLDEIQNGRYRKLYFFPLLYSTITFFVLTLLQIFNIMQFTQTLIFVHIGLLLCVVTIVATIIIDFYKKYLSEYIFIGIGFFGLLATAVFEMILYYLNTNLTMGTVLAIGLLFLLIMAIIKSGQDLITSERNKQQAIMAKNAQTKFLANMSHEIRTPINVIIGMNEMILRENEDASIQGYAHDIQNASNMLLGLVNDILDFTKIESGQLELAEDTYNLSSLLQDLSLLFKARAGGKPISTKVDIDANLPSKLYGDDIRIKQILVNILSNAVKYTKQGSVSLKVYFRQINEEYITLCFSVTDTGIGIKEEDLTKLFDSFKRLDLNKNRTIQGSGLGLNIAKQLVELMNGTITVKSTYGEGSTFNVYIPQKVIDTTPIQNIDASLAQSRNTAAKANKFTAEKATILVVDDNMVNLSLMKGLLKRTLVNVDTASSGKKALELTKEKTYNLIFMDHMMPEMDGVETLHLLRKDMANPNHDATVIALTANAISGCREQYLGYGFDDYFSKPIQADKLDDLLTRMLPQELITWIN